MQYFRPYRRFITSYYLTEGLRITFGIALPAVLLNYFGELHTGIAISLGAMCVTITDTPGPIHHRRNAMLICAVWVALVSVMTALAVPWYLLTGALITIFCFFNCMIGVFGGRANSIGVASLVIMVLSLDHQLTDAEVVYRGLYILAGGIWYMLLSLALYGIRPYKLAQQAVGELIGETAAYLRIRAEYYSKDAAYDQVGSRLREQQVVVEKSQRQVSELLFRSRRLVKESTPIGRTLVLMYVDISDLFEKSMTAYRDYQLLHHDFDQYDILPRFQHTIFKLAAALDETGIAIQASRRMLPDDHLLAEVAELKKEFLLFRSQSLNAERLEGFISLRQILSSMEDIAQRIQVLQGYTNYDLDKSRAITTETEAGALQLAEQKQVSWKIFRSNLSFRSDVFRHALRVSIATLAGYIISRYLAFGHSYWILLTIIVILKPNYSLTKKRNYDRLIGTIAGALIGLGILYFIKNERALFAVLLFAIAGTYSFVRSNYRIGVVFMTVYVLLLFHLIYGGTMETIIEDRIVDTAIGSAIAFAANLLIIPMWEKDRISSYMLTVLDKVRLYFEHTAAAFAGSQENVKLSRSLRNELFVALANLSDAFNRMMSEPSFTRENTDQLHRFVVLNNRLASHIAALAQYAGLYAPPGDAPGFQILTHNITRRLQRAAGMLSQSADAMPAPDLPDPFNQYLSALLKARQEEIKTGLMNTPVQKKLSAIKPVADQFNMIFSIAGDIEKLVAK